jgi:hypothetical protein
MWENEIIKLNIIWFLIEICVTNIDTKFIFYHISPIFLKLLNSAQLGLFGYRGSGFAKFILFK